MENQKFNLSKMTETDARELLSWQYPPPEDYYNLPEENREADVQRLVEPTNLYLAVRGNGDELTAYYCFGSEAQTPGGDYDENALDIRGWARPDLVGSGMGPMFVRLAVDFGQMFFKPEFLRATVPAFNSRARHLCKKMGFAETQEFTDDSGIDYVVLVKKAESPEAEMPE